MRHFDHDYVDDVIVRLRGLKPDTKPAWGVLTPPRMIQHLAQTVRYSMGRLGDSPDVSNVFLRAIVRPLMLNGIMPILKNLKAPDYPQINKADDLESLQAVLEEYLGLVQLGEFNPKPHPAFGPIGIDGWAKMHLRHFEHHLRQFGV